MSDICSVYANSIKTVFQNILFNEDKPSRPIVISGGSETYERTFPKFG